MENVFDLYPEFIQTDIRKDRTSNSYPVTNRLMVARHENLLPLELIKGRTILDLGCCVGATGAWVLYHGAKKYTGIDIDIGFVEQAKTNLSGRFDETRWEILQTSIEDFIKTNTKKYDIIMASGIIYAVFDTVDFVNCLADTCGTLIIESQHPMYDWKDILSQCLPETIHDEFFKNFNSQPLFERFAAMCIKKNYMVNGQSGVHHDTTYGTYPSIDALKILLSNRNFDMDWKPYGALKQQIPEIYGPKRFAMVFHKRKQTQKFPTVLQVV